MKLVVDTNCIVSALIRDGLSRAIILLSDIDFISPEYALEEIKRYKSDIISKSEGS